MELSKQVVSLELAKKLKELGVGQDANTLFWWHKILYKDGHEETVVKYGYVLHDDSIRESQMLCVAFTVAELLELLDEEITIPKVANIADYIAEKLCTKKQN